MSVAERQQTCPRCTAELDVSGTPVGTWLACPGCAQPIQVAARRVERPARPTEPEPPSSAWLSDPRLDRPAPVPAAPKVTETTPPLPAWSPSWSHAAPSAAAGKSYSPEPALGTEPYTVPPPAAAPARRRGFGGVVFMLSVMGATAQVIFVTSVLQAISRPEDVAMSALFGAALGAFVAMMAVSIRREDEARARRGG